jgi:hypothetical protein
MSYLVKPKRVGVNDALGLPLPEQGLEVTEPTTHWLRAEQTGDVQITEVEAVKPSKKAKE